MIVHCTSCQAKFRIADEKIGPRGAKARCSRCQAVFAVHRDLGAMPLPDGEPRPAQPSDAPPPAVERPSVTAGRAPLDVELERPERGAPPAADPFEFSPPDHVPERASAAATEPDPFAAAGLSASAAAPFGWTLPSPGGRDPFGATADPFETSADPFASPFESADPFPPAASSSAEPDPFAGGVCESFGISEADPFAAPEGEAPAFEEGPSWPARPDAAALLAQAGPFAQSPSPTALRGLPLTDLSDLLGDGSGPSAPLGAPSSAGAAPRAGPDLTLEDRATPPAFRAPALARDLSLGAPEPVFGGGRGLALESEPAFGFGSPNLELAGEISLRQRLSPAPAAEPWAARPRYRPDPGAGRERANPSAAPARGAGSAHAVDPRRARHPRRGRRRSRARISLSLGRPRRPRAAPAPAPGRASPRSP